MFSIFGEQLLLTGEAGQAPMRSILSSSGMSDFNADPSITNMTDVILALNDATTGFFAETWSLKLADIITQHSVLKTKLENATVTTPFPNSGIADQLKMVTRLMQTAETRGVTRDIFFVADGGYDTHTNVDATLTRNFANLNAALEAFVAEVKTLNLWESTTLVQFSEFGRTLDPNTNFGSDHGWGGIHFMMGGAVNGGKVLGKYPDDFEQSDSNHTNPIALGRGRMIPTHPWDAMWYGTAQWFGVTEENDMEKVLPMWKNFDSDLCYNASELFTINQTGSSSEFV